MDAPTVKSFHAALLCRKWHECVSFYRDVLDFPVMEQMEGFMEFQVSREARIGLIRTVRASESERRDENFILSFRVSDVDKTRRMLAPRLPGLAEARDHPWGARVLELRDPEGRRIEFWTPQHPASNNRTTLKRKPGAAGRLRKGPRRGSRG